MDTELILKPPKMTVCWEEDNPAWGDPAQEVASTLSSTYNVRSFLHQPSSSSTLSKPQAGLPAVDKRLGKVLNGPASKGKFGAADEEERT